MENGKQQRQGGAAFPLMLGSPGESLCISRVPTDKGSAERLASLGLQQGDVIRVVQNQAGSLLIENAAGTRYVLGGGMANKIFVTRS